MIGCKLWVKSVLVKAVLCALKGDPVMFVVRKGGRDGAGGSP